MFNNNCGTNAIMFHKQNFCGVSECQHASDASCHAALSLFVRNETHG